MSWARAPSPVRWKAAVGDAAERAEVWRDLQVSAAFAGANKCIQVAPCPAGCGPQRCSTEAYQAGCSGGAVCNGHVGVTLLVPSKGAASQFSLGLCWN